MLDEISCRISSRMPSEMLSEINLLVQQTQALYRRFGMSGGHPPEPPGPEWTQALYRRFGISGGHPPEPPGPSKRKLYIRDLAYQGDTPLNPPVRANASFISEIWHIRETLPWIPRSEQTQALYQRCSVECLVKCSVECSMKCSVKCLLKCWWNAWWNV